MPNWGYSIQGLDKDKTAIASGRDLRVSPKRTREVCHTIKGMMLSRAKEYLEQVIMLKAPVPFRRFNKKSGHRHGMQQWKFDAGKFPEKSARIVFEVLSNAESNAEYKGLDAERLRIVHTAVMIRFTKSLAIRPGLRSEYTSVLNTWNLAPRFALALKTGKDAQLSAAWGLYHQTPQSEYLKISTNLGFEKAMHYILSYQFGEVSKRLFRAEAYYKTYNDLITWQRNDFGQPSKLKNSGSGYAQGMDLFWRDQKSIKGFDYWVTYSYIDTKRRYINFPEKATPDFISNHTFSTVAKYWLSKISTQVGASITVASGRPYNNPNSESFMSEKTLPYTDLSLNFSHIFYLGNQYSVLYCSMNNVLGNDNVLSYRTTGIADAQENYSLIPVKRNLKRFVFVGLFLNF